ncbi:NADPH-dependent 7-cyano-7-deazaguanine reductase QueF [Aestuariibacter salexigens]|uniref:NADPH-dependent 7-cyano-7-deazaguanine reductase QueF n=1 Tax=Aestuariibacter salexigens TaxID=226010 RepID=UPI000412620A|nr:NADPH-dependent 7-cyano-7-deazaguanine reductase QueF [Aestuariibacter salexigens]
MTKKLANESGHVMNSLSLGKPVEYSDQYDPSLLQAVPRSINRAEFEFGACLPFTGTDRWTGYELSWLNQRGKPCVAIMQCDVPADSANLIESKSFKLYLNSFIQTRFADKQHVVDTLVRDLSACAGLPVDVSLFDVDTFVGQTIDNFNGTCIDNLDIEVEHYQLRPDLLKIESQQFASETLVSHLLKSNCLITNQPDWGSVQIHYQGPQIDHGSLLKYLISFRQHNEFHEQCVERIFHDISAYCKPEKLSVYARYTRRGGLDINPFRSNFEAIPDTRRLARQ